jgi:uncharacterized protein YecT (DUF1311 family)
MPETNQGSDRPHMSNRDLKVAADIAYKESASEMQSIYNDLFKVLNDKERRELAEAQDAWRDFAEKQAIFASGLMRGGTGESLVYLEEMHSLTRARITAFRKALSERSAV